MLSEEIILEFLGRQIFRMQGINQKALAALNIETELMKDIGLNEAQIGEILLFFRNEFCLEFCEKQFAEFNSSVFFFVEQLGAKELY